MSGTASLFRHVRRRVAAHFVTRQARRNALAMWERAKQPRPERDPLWRDFAEAELQADGERLADIGDWIIHGVPVELFRLTENERVFVEAYIFGGRDV